MSDEPTNLVLELLRQIRTTQDEHGRSLAKIERRILAIELNITRIRRENAGDAESAASTLPDHEDRLRRLEHRDQ